MPTRYYDASRHEHHQRAAELHDLAADAHRAAEQHWKQVQLTSHESSREALERSYKAHQHTKSLAAQPRLNGFGHDDLAVRAYNLWERRGWPEGSADED
jgi:hypothetical protein